MLATLSVADNAVVTVFVCQDKARVHVLAMKVSYCKPQRSPSCVELMTILLTCRWVKKEKDLRFIIIENDCQRAV